MNMSLKIKCNQNNPYFEHIRRFLVGGFPKSATKSQSDILELVTAEILASGKLRYGPKPSVEAQVEMRKVVAHWVEKNEPIPFVVPWASEKPDGTGIDVAELSAFKTLTCLNDRVKQYFEPGVFFNFRVEDLSAPHQFFYRADAARAEAKLYTEQLVDLPLALGLSDFIRIVPDSWQESEEKFNKLADSYLPVFEKHLDDLDNPNVHEMLKNIGWDKPIDPLTVQHYMRTYDKLYPLKSLELKRNILARYFAGGLTRKVLGLTSIMPHWDGQFLDIYFGQTPPALHPSRYLRRIHYRTIPENLTSLHMPPWRAKGYLLVDEENNVTPKLASFNDLPPGLEQYSVELENGETKITVQSDYLLKTA